MEVTIRVADLIGHRREICDALSEFLNPIADDHRFEWLYLNNPHGEAQAWLAYINDVVIGVGAAFRRRFRLSHGWVTAWVLGDFCLDPQYRSLGPALQLQRACLSVTETNEGAFCYDFPSATMVTVYKRLGFSVSGKMVRLAKPLRVDRKVKEMIQNRAAQRVVATVGNTLLKIRSPRPTPDGGLETSTHQGACGEEFTTLAEQQRGKFGFCLERSAAYLNWRYVSNPLASHEIVTARRSGRLVGYIVWTQAEEDASIVDLFAEEDPKMVTRLIDEVTALAQKSGVETLSVSINEAHPWHSLFSEMGFRLRDSAPVVIIPSKTFPHKIDPQLTGWYLMRGDRDS